MGLPPYWHHPSSFVLRGVKVIKKGTLAGPAPHRTNNSSAAASTAATQTQLVRAAILITCGGGSNAQQMVGAYAGIA